MGRDVPGLVQKSDAAFLSSSAMPCRVATSVHTQEAFSPDRHFVLSADARPIRFLPTERRLATADVFPLVAVVELAAVLMACIAARASLLRHVFSVCSDSRMFSVIVFSICSLSCSPCIIPREIRDFVVMLSSEVKYAAICATFLDGSFSSPAFNRLTERRLCSRCLKTWTLLLLLWTGASCGETDVARGQLTSPSFRVARLHLDFFSRWYIFTSSAFLLFSTLFCCIQYFWYFLRFAVFDSSCVSSYVFTLRRLRDFFSLSCRSFSRFSM